MNRNATLIDLFKSMFKNWNLIIQMTRREILIRYKGSFLGLIWAIVNPMIMLGIYTLIFGVIFRADWGGRMGNNSDFAFTLFVGLTVYQLFSEALIKSPMLIVNNANFVKKVIFPLEILPFVSLLASLFQMFINLLILIGYLVFFKKVFFVSMIFFPIIIIPHILFTLGVSYFFSSISVFIRDANQIVTYIATLVLYVTPIFYPLSAVPEKLRYLTLLNPISYVVEEARNSVVFGLTPQFLPLAVYAVISVIILALGYYFFQRTKPLFADVL
ncbi:ABC transporter permease [Leptospira congkakensis]|uniref:Transport permease protein n=1 Tax=Leptospira congkakensis TaxID=2484932 RepID=A0A4Z1AKZ4_9LEPT|nr:ABC transporter permease [Leptospira congkakensis]TGL90223.1 ABC transporter permease [Leptospira congkakensis]TGL91229.1 ABC transporter permease [Leptospira congkakensis]TGL98281.1 ABC transporter permease [Leptospira congkakensis]